MARDDVSPTEIPEQIFRKSEAFRHVAEVKSERKRQARAEWRARWPLSRVVKLALIYGGPLAVLVGWYWAGKVLNMGGGG